jgi:Zn-dependent alcohol dehydrogenase
MKTKAAVIYEPGKRLGIEELNLDGPQAGEVLIRYTHAGLCQPWPIRSTRPRSWTACWTAGPPGAG